MINIEQLLPFLKTGFVHYNNVTKDWHFNKLRKKCFFRKSAFGEYWIYEHEGRVFQDFGYNISEIFDIEPAKDWTKSLRRCGDHLMEEHNE